MAMVTVTTLRQYLPEITGTTANTDLEALLDRVETATARYMGWPKPDSFGLSSYVGNNIHNIS